MKRLLPHTFIYLITLMFCLLTSCSAGFMPAVNPKSLGVPPSATTTVHQVTLLLPLQGPLGASGQAIRNGFLAAYYQAKEAGQNAPTINVVDTSTAGNIVSAYEQAVSKGADFIVGPLTKPQIQTLASQGNLSVPTLALNTLDNSSAVTNLVQFGLSPRDEANQAAEKARASGYRRVLIIAASDNWAQNIANTFVQNWQSAGGQVVANVAFSTQQSIAPAVRQALGITLTETTKKDPAAQDSLRNRVHATADVIFIVGLPQQARQIMPFLKFYYADSIPVYATSAIYNGASAVTQNQDLNGVIFCDMPWMLDSAALTPNLAALHSRIITLWPESFASNPRLYALGVDAYHLMGQFDRLHTAPQAGIAGASGVLYLTPDNQLHRRLSWAQMRDGVPVAF